MPDGDDQMTETQAEPEYLDFGGRRVQANDETRGLHADWQNQQRELQRLRDESRRFQSEAEEMRAARDAEDAASDAQPTQDDLQREAEELANLQMADPVAYRERILQEAENRAWSRIQTEFGARLDALEWDDAVEALQDRYPDFDELNPQMQAFIEQNPDAVQTPGDMENVYFRVKSQTQSAFNPEDPQAQLALLTDSRFEPVRQALIRDYLQKKAQQAASVPAVLAEQPGGSTPLAPPQQIKSMADATKAWRASGGRAAG